jgi:hypothetical protein
MKKSMLKIQSALFLAASVLFGLTTDAVGQGSLIPPGSPSPTMKTLDQVHPGTPISAIPFTISSAGSYFLTTNVTGVTGSNGISIEIGDVTLDLNGFNLIGVPGSLSGIMVSAPHATIQNGIVRNWGTNGVNAFHWAAQDSVFKSLIVVSNGGAGLDAGTHAIVEDCVAAYNAKYGFSIGAAGLVRNCTAHRNGSFGFNSYNSGTWGPGGTITGCISTHNTVGIVPSQNGLVSENSCLYNTFSGIALQANGARIENNVLCHNNNGLDTSGYTNLVIRNSFSGNTNLPIYNNFSWLPTGPLINAAGVLTNLNPSANFTY